LTAVLPRPLGGVFGNGGGDFDVLNTPVKKILLHLNHFLVIMWREKRVVKRLLQHTIFLLHIKQKVELLKGEWMNLVLYCMILLHDLTMMVLCYMPCQVMLMAQHEVHF
jgi:hypothetical protein